MAKRKIICFMKPNSRVKAFLEKNFDVTIIDSYKDYINFQAYGPKSRYDYVISYLSPWILGKDTLNLARFDTINFHPAPPEYPGSAGYNLAIYNKESEYGTTVHRMIEKVDSGEIFFTTRFALIGNETVLELRQRTRLELEIAFYDCMSIILTSGAIVYPLGKKWKSKPHTFKELKELCNCTGITDHEELALRIRATFFPGANDFPYIKIKGKKYRIIEEP